MGWLDDLKARSLARRTMIDFDLNVDYVVSAADRDGMFAENRNVSDFVIRNAIAARYKEGNDDPDIQRLGGRLQNALIRAVRDDLDVVEISEEQLRFVANTLKAWKVPPQLWAWHIDLTDAVQAALAQLKDERAAAAKNGERVKT